MQYRTLGRTQLKLSEIGFGAWGIGGKQWQGGSDDESLAALRRAVDLGLNFIDTALAYGDAHSEKLIGKFLDATPESIFVATKIPPKNRRWPAVAGIGIGEVFPRDYIVRCTEESLRNLGVDTIDLQQLHVWNPEWTDRDEWRRGLEDIKSSGKARFVGVSITEHDPDSALSVVETGLIDAVQVIYNIFDPSPEQNLFPLCRRHDIGVLARVPFDEGSLTGAITESTTFQPDEFRAFYFRGDRPKQVVQHVNALKKDLSGQPATLPEIALAFCLSHPAVSTVIPGMRRIQNVETNLAVSGRPLITPELREILARHAWNKNFYT